MRIGLLSFVWLSVASMSLGAPPSVWFTALPIPVNDPIPIQRILVTDEQLTALKGQFREPYSVMTRRDFERLVQQAANRPHKTASLISHARYEATYLNGSLIGTAEFTLRRLAEAGSRVSLGSPNFAFANQDSFLHIEIDPARELIATLPNRTDQLRLEWSLRSTPDNPSRKFVVSAPPSNTAEMALSIPNTLILNVTSQECIVTGPTPSIVPGHSQWLLRWCGDRLLEFRITTPDPQSHAHLIRSQITTRLDPVRPTTIFHIDAEPSPTRSEWNLRVPDGHRLTAIHGANVRSFRESSPGRWVVAMAGSADPIRFDVETESNPGSPLQRLAIDHSLVTNESISVVVPAGHSAWLADVGDFQCRDVETTAEGDHLWTFRSVRKEQASELRLLPTLAVAATPKRPSVNSRDQFLAEATRDLLSVQVVLSVENGPIHESRFRVPDGFQKIDDDLESVDPHASWVSHGPLAVIHWGKPLQKGQSRTLSFSFSRNYPLVSEPIHRGIPALQWLGANRTGQVSVKVSADFQRISPLIVAFQDLLPNAELSLAHRRPNSTPIEPLASREPSQTVQQISTIRTILETKMIRLIQSGRSDEPHRLPIDPSMQAMNLRVQNIRIERPDRNDGWLTIPAGEFEFEQTLPRLSQPISSFSSVRFGRVMTSVDDHMLQFGNQTIVIPQLIVLSLVVTLLGLGLIVASVYKSRRISVGWLIALLASVTVISPIVVVSFLGLAFAAWSIRRRANGIALGCLLIVTPLQTAPNDRIAVYFHMKDAGELFVTLPTSLRDRLEKLAKPADFMIRSADYRLTERDESIFGDARWIVDCAVASRIEIPLRDVRVQNVKVNGQSAFPLPLEGGGFSLDIPEAGRVVVETTFQAVIQSQGIERFIRFHGPDRPIGTLTFTSQQNSRSAFVENRKGQQTVNDSLKSISADLGDGTDVNVRWRVADSEPILNSESTREISVWDLNDQKSVVMTAIQFPVIRAYDPKWEVVIPEGLELLSVEGRRGNGQSIPCEWSQPSTTRTVISFRTIIDGRPIAILTCRLRQSPTRQETLSAPTAAKNADSQAVIAMRLQNLTARELSRNHVVDLTIEAAQRIAVIVPEFNFEKSPPQRAFRRNGESPSVTLRLDDDPTESPFRHSQAWTLGPRSHVIGEITGTRSHPSFIRIPIPAGMTVLAIRGSDILDSWIDESEMRIVLRGSDEASTIRWFGMLDGHQVEQRTLPILRATGVPTETILNVSAINGWQLNTQTPDQIADSTMSIPMSVQRLTTTVVR